MVPVYYLFIVFLLFLILGSIWTQFTNKENFESNHSEIVVQKKPDFKIHSWIINLDKNKDRLNQSMGYYNASDLSVVPINRYSAVVGAKLEPEDWLSDYALKEFYETEKRKYRTRHYQLTKGGIGCFLSHVNLMKQLVEEKETDIYLILEDDIRIDKSAYLKISKILENPPEKWDMLLLGYSKIFNYNIETNDYAKVRSFWGTYSYLINKGGAQKFLNQYKTIDCQIDSLMSWMAIKKKLDIYALVRPVIFPDSFYTDIQINIFPVNIIDAFTYQDVYLGE